MTAAAMANRPYCSGPSSRASTTWMPNCSASCSAEPAAPHSAAWMLRSASPGGCGMALPRQEQRRAPAPRHLAEQRELEHLGNVVRRAHAPVDELEHERRAERAEGAKDDAGHDVEQQ